MRDTIKDDWGSGVRLLVTDAAHAVAAETIVNLPSRYPVDYVLGTAPCVALPTNSLPGFDRIEFVRGPGPDGYWGEIAELARTYRIDVVLPWSDGDALALAPHRDYFTTAGTVLVCPDAALIKFACDKWRTMAALRQAGLPVPASRLVHGPDDLVAAAHDLGYPDHDLVVKPRSRAGSMGIWAISKRSGLLQQGALPTLTLGAIAELCTAADDIAWPEGLILQRRMIGGDVSVDVFALDGRVVAGGCRSRKLTMAGLCVGGKVYPLTGALRETISSLIAALMWTGVANIQLIIGTSGAQTVYEINPRLSGSIDVNTLGGLDLLGGLIEYARTARLPWDGEHGSLTTIIKPVSFLRHWVTHSWINS